MQLKEKELELFHQLYDRGGGEFITVISPKTGFPYTTPVNHILHNGKFYTSTNRKAAKIKFIKQGSTKGCLTYYVNESARKPYVGMNGIFRLLGIDDDPGIQEGTTKFVSELSESIPHPSDSDESVSQLLSWLQNPDRLVIEFTPENVFGKTRGAL